MVYEVRKAEPDDAGEILRLVKSDFTRVGFAVPDEVTDEEIAELAKRIEGGGDAERVVALGHRGIAAYIKFGRWSAGNENQFVGNVLEAQRNRLRRFGGQTGLFTLAVHGNEPGGYHSEAVDALIVKTDIFTVRPGQVLKVPVAGVDYPQMFSFKEFLKNHGVEPTGKMGMLAVANVADEARGELWQKTNAA